ncbi:MAG: transpeptidase family protein [Deltaproteobacteria bacterium]|nr:transpeptidase family protein [Deltaproteobacteria bacterium]MBW2071625.1 transpeptidase family protein [Deltaproteobacteria bacterium]
MKHSRHAQEQTGRWVRCRLVLVSAGLFVGLTLLLGRSVQLQLLQQDLWTSLAEKQIQRNLRFESRRGDIFDRNEQELAVSVQVDSLAANPRLIGNARAAAAKLAPILGMSRAKLTRKLRRQRSFVWLKHYLSPRKADRIRALGLKGIHFVKETRRYYPNGALAGHTLGFVGLDKKGLEGLERSQDHLLRGHPNTQEGAKDARGGIIYTQGLPESETPAGYSLRLTLDRRIQYLAERELERTVSAFAAKGGVAVVLEPATGEILALAVAPPFNPNSFTSYTPSDWRNRAVTDTFEPGSTFKIFLAAAALEEGVVQPQDIFYCEQGKYRIHGHTIHDAKKYGWLSLARIIQFSSNIGAVKVGEKLGARTYYRYIRAFGFGTPTGIDFPGETGGTVRPPENWTSVDLAAASFGQGISVSALQLAAAVAAVANNGLLMKPYLIKDVLDLHGRVVQQHQPQVVRRVISAATAQRLKKILVRAVSPEGTGSHAALAHYSTAGKTGTAQKSSLRKQGYASDRYTASFVGFTPVDQPKIVVAVVINEPSKGHYGGVVAAPAFRRIASQTLHCLHVPPDREERSLAYHFQETRIKTDFPEVRSVLYSENDGSSSHHMPDVRGLSLRAALDQLADISLPVTVKGSGRVVKQSPKPGADLTRIRSCRLVLRDD